MYMSKWSIWGWCLIVIGCIGLLWFIGKGCAVADKVTNVETAFINYEQFFEIHNTCVQINMDLGAMRALPDSDKMFEQFSKVQRVNALQLQMNRWIQDYNAKSAMWHRGMWRDAALPYTLTTKHFSNY